MNGFWRIFCIFHIFLGITSVFFFFLLVLSNYIGHKSSFKWAYLYNFCVYKKYKVNVF